MDYYCKFEDKINEIYADLKVLVSEFKAMNGTLRETKNDFDCHKKESIEYRYKITIVWTALHTIKWAIVLLFGTGIIWKLFEVISK